MTVRGYFRLVVLFSRLIPLALVQMYLKLDSHCQLDLFWNKCLYYCTRINSWYCWVRTVKSYILMRFPITGKTPTVHQYFFLSRNSPLLAYRPHRVSNLRQWQAWRIEFVWVSNKFSSIFVGLISGLHSRTFFISGFADWGKPCSKDSFA